LWLKARPHGIGDHSKDSLFRLNERLPNGFEIKQPSFLLIFEPPKFVQLKAIGSGEHNFPKLSGSKAFFI
jgi:hypothetical protein